MNTSPINLVPFWVPFEEMFRKVLNWLWTKAPAQGFYWKSEVPILELRIKNWNLIFGTGEH